ncbi:MAG: DUF350 domain-containing protein [Actinomycetota bacterium]|nr:DUF350 domain-containing protein [Actinomycetota bacterium]
MMEELVSGILATVAYAATGLVVLVVGYAMLDVITPGRLRQLVFAERNVNATTVVSANILALTMIVTMAILESDDVLSRGLVQAAAYGLLGVVLQVVSFKILDVVTPGHLGRIITHERPDPAAAVVAVISLAMGAVFAASIT